MSYYTPSYHAVIFEDDPEDEMLSYGFVRDFRKNDEMKDMKFPTLYLVRIDYTKMFY